MVKKRREGGEIGKKEAFFFTEGTILAFPLIYSGTCVDLPYPPPENNSDLPRKKTLEGERKGNLHRSVAKNPSLVLFGPKSSLGSSKK